MNDETREPQPTPLQIQQTRLVEESIRDAISIFVGVGIPPACIATGLKMATIRFATAERGGPPQQTH